MNKLVCISDTHCRHSKLQLPEGDILIHAGDYSGYGTFEEMMRFATWLGEQKSKFSEILVTNGNHDRFSQANPQIAKDTFAHFGIKLLVHEPIEVNGVKFFFSPWTPDFCNWAWMRPRGEELKKTWAQIPDDTEVLVTHGQPKGILDDAFGDSVGDEDLLNRIKELKNLKVVVGGHLHSNNNKIKIDGITYINAAICNEDYQPVQMIRTIELDK